MKRLFSGPPDILLALGIALAVAAALLWTAEASEPSAHRLARVREHLEADFQVHVAEANKESARITRDYKETGDIGPRSQIVRFVADRNCRLIDWSNSELLPSQRIIADLCNYPTQRTLQDNNKIYYLLRHETPEFYLVTLIPVTIRYKVENAFLPGYIFLGRYQHQSAIAAQTQGIEIYQRQVASGLNIFDAKGNFVFSLTLPDPKVFSYPLRTGVLTLALLAWLVLSVGSYLRLRERSWRIGKVWIPAPALLLLATVGIRALLFYFDLPNAYRPMELFSPTILAIGDWSPSLGDLLLNVMLCLSAIFVMLRSYHRHISRLYRRALRVPLQAWLLQCLVLTVCVGGTWWFWNLTDDLVRHSTIRFEFSNVFQLSTYSYLAFALISMALVALQLVLLELLRFSFHFLRGPRRVAKIGLSLAWLTGLSMVVFPVDAIMWGCVVAVFGLSLLVFYRTRRAMTLRLDLLNLLLLISIFSLLTTTGLSHGILNKQYADMEGVADRQSDEHDLITESLFERVVNEVEADAYLLDYTEMQGLARRLSEQFFENSFKGYEVRIFIYDDSLTLRDRTGDSRPYLAPNSDPSLEQMGRSTMTPDLYLVKYYKGLFESIYVGKFELLLRSLGKILVWVELEPTEIQPNRLYPQLLLDDHVRMKELVASSYDFAVYTDGRLFRKSSAEPFPMHYLGPPLGDTLTYQHSRDAHWDHVIYRVGSDKIVHVRKARPGFFDAINLFSFIFYFYVLFSIMALLPFRLLEFLRHPRMARRMTLKSRIQVFFLSFAILPLFIVVFFLSPYIRAHIYTDLQQDLLQQTQQVAAQVRDDYLKLRRNQLTYSAVHGQISKKLYEKLVGTLTAIEKTFFNDINIYSAAGELHMSTQPTIYQLGLTSRMMNPNVFRRMRSGLISDAVVEDQIGEVTYFSAFYPIMNDDRRIVGFLNIPSYKNQDRVNAQSLSLLTLLVNIYVFIFLAIGILAVLISNSIIRPLALLSRRLGDTTLGQRNEPLAWDSKDEIGEIIQAYNEMLQKLAASELKLAQSERESAWQEMARQVAHEIKNPLTPMRLSVQHLVRAWESDRPSSDRLNNLFEKVTKTILVQVESLVNIANSFSQFANMPAPNRSRFKLQDVVQEVCDLYAHGEGVQLQLATTGEDFYVHSDRDQLSRVLNNIVKNAGQAIEHDQGRIEVRMDVLGTLARISVADNGKGIPEEIQARIFEPRFSTKSSGMGLGLAIVKKIVESAGGKIYFESEVGKGTTFFVELPSADSSP
jgi:two-component system, NtrC family, nitrogen regulation sensor histidine kinase NtrY